MKVLLAADYPVIEQDEKFYVQDKMYMILQRYYNAFGEIKFCTRIEKCERPKEYLDISKFISSVIPVSLPSSLFGLDNKKMKQAMQDCDLVIGRFDSIVSCRAARIARRLHKPFFAELMADAWDGYWNHGFVGKLLAPYMYYENKSAVKNADFALYVTREFLQRRYPCNGITTNASNVYLNEPSEDVLKKRLARIEQMDTKNISLATTADVNVIAKGQHFVIKAMAKLKEKGIYVTYYLIGGGDQGNLKKIARDSGVEDQVIFLGAMSLQDVLTTLDGIDIYIQPSLQEGLPRATIEAMSRACPCLGSTTAGIPELLSKECVFKRRSIDDIVRVLSGILDKKRLAELAKENFNMSKEYTDEVLSVRRNKFYEQVKDKLK